MTRLKRELEDRGISQTAFAKQIGANRSQVNLYCNGRIQPNFQKMQRMADALNMDIRVLFAEAIR